MSSFTYLWVEIVDETPWRFTSVQRAGVVHTGYGQDLRRLARNLSWRASSRCSTIRNLEHRSRTHAEIDERNYRKGCDGYSLICSGDFEAGESIGNMVPRAAAKAIETADTLVLSSRDVWFRRLTFAMTVSPA